MLFPFFGGGTIYLMNHKDFKELMEAQVWRFARTYANKCPHEYIVLSQLDREVREQCIQAARFIREAGFLAYYYSRKGFYFICSDYYYWTMDDPVESTTIINRAFLADYCLNERRWEWKGKKL